MKLFIHGLGDNNKSIQVSNPMGQAARDKPEWTENKKSLPVRIGTFSSTTTADLK